MSCDPVAPLWGYVYCPGSTPPARLQAPMTSKLRLRSLVVLITTFVALGWVAPPTYAQSTEGLDTSGFDAAVPTPKSHFGFDIGEHRKLANWDQLTSYYESLAQTSQRIVVDTLGPTEDDRPFVMLTITSPENHANVDALHAIQMKLADPRAVVDEDELESLIAGGKVIVLITHGIHATEVGSSQAAARLAYRMAASTDPKILEILDQVILLQIPSLNPDGLSWVADWYMRYVGTEYEGATLPWLYHKYVGHDNNRDWFTAAMRETQHTITKAHNAWHPQIVHDIHQMGGNGARIFFPPYIDPIDPNVDPGIITAVNQLGTYMAAELTAQGKDGIVVNAIYDGFHPGRQYQHYHAGARILSETASAQLATPVELPSEAVRGGRNYEASQRSSNFPWPWPGGEWGLPDIVDYQEAGALALLTNAAKNREYWLRNFWGINKRAVDGWDTWPAAWVIPADQDPAGLNTVLRILTMGDVEVHQAMHPFRANDTSFPEGTYVIPMTQPYAAFANTMLAKTEYPDLREYPGGPPQRPYDVTAHSIPLLMGITAESIGYPVEALLSEAIPVPEFNFEAPRELRGRRAPDLAIYKGFQEPMMAGWTRWVFDQHRIEYDTLHNVRMQAGDLKDDFDAIVFQGQSTASILNGHGSSMGPRGGLMPPEYQGGIGEAGARALVEFVEDGGRLVAIEEATELMIELFDLPVRNVTEGLPSTEFYIPGSILKIVEADGSENVAWYWRTSRAFEVQGPNVTPVAWFAPEDPLMAGWALGREYIQGKVAAVSARVGRGEVILFGFQPNYRSQTVATWPLLWKALGDGWR